MEDEQRKAWYRYLYFVKYATPSYALIPTPLKNVIEQGQIEFHQHRNIHRPAATSREQSEEVITAMTSHELLFITASCRL